MDAIEYAVTRLTETHTVHLEGAEYECEPLLTQLREAMTSSIGAGSGGGSGDGGLINVAAFTMWEQIDGVARAWLLELERFRGDDIAGVIQRLIPAIKAAHANGILTDEQRDELNSYPARWVTMIEDLFDPPHTKELTAPCPDCGERWVTNEERDPRGRVVETKQSAAVVIPVKRGRAIVAECRACGALWATESRLLELAEGMGIEVDFAALRDLVSAV